MRAAFAIAWMFVAAGCAATPRPDVKVPQSDSLSAQAQFEVLRSLKGDWWGRGGQGTDRNVVEFKYRVMSEGAVVAETCFSGTPEETLTLYSVESGQLVGTRYTTSGTERLVGCEPRPVWKGRGRLSGPTTMKFIDNCGVETEVSARMPPAGGDIEWTLDRNPGLLVFSITDPTKKAIEDSSTAAEFDLTLMGTETLYVTSWEDRSSADLRGIKAYQLTRKLPGSVERRASPEGAEDPRASAGKSRGPVRAYGDLRSDP